MGEFSYTYFWYLKNEVLKDMPHRGFEIFMDACPLCEFCNIDYTSESSFLEKWKKVRSVGFNSSEESHVTSTFDQRYPAFLMGNSSWNVNVGTILPVFSTLY